MIADHGHVFCYDSSILPTINKSFRNLVPDIEIAVHLWPWAPLSVVSLMVSVWHSRTLEGSALDLFPLKFGNAPQTSPWFHQLYSCIWNRLSCRRLDSLILPLSFFLVSRMLILKHLSYEFFVVFPRWENILRHSGKWCRKNLKTGNSLNYIFH